MHAVLLVEPHTQHVAWCRDGDGPDEAYRVARELAAKVGAGAELEPPTPSPTAAATAAARR